jgi:hypothetical protein
MLCKWVIMYYTIHLELGEDYVGRRYDAYFTNIPVNKITEQKYRSKVEEVISELQGQLIIKEYSPG